MDDEGLELLFQAPTAASQSGQRPVPDWLCVEKELRRRSVTRLLLWEEYRAAIPMALAMTFAAWQKRVRPSMRQTYIGGEKVFVDFAGDSIDIFDPITGEVRARKPFVAAMEPRTTPTPRPAQARACPTGSSNPDYNIEQLGFITRWTPVKKLTFSADVTWSHLDQNFVGTLSVPSASIGKPALVSEWMGQDTVTLLLRAQRNW